MYHSYYDIGKGKDMKNNKNTINYCRLRPSQPIHDTSYREGRSTGIMGCLI